MKRFCSIFLPALTLCMCSPPARADLWTQTSGRASCSNSYGTVSDNGGYLADGTFFAGTDGICGPEYAEAFAAASASYGDLYASAWGNWNFDNRGDVYETSSAAAGFSDEITISGGSGSGTLQYQATPASAYVTSDLPSLFTFGVPFLISASVSAWGCGGGSCFGGAWGTTDFEISSITVSGEGEDFQYSTASGAPYPFTDAQYVPEPSSVFLFGFCLAACLWRVRLIPLFDSITPTVPSRPKRDP
jgi:hypothetical protein